MRPGPTLDQVAQILSAYKECFGTVYDHTLELDNPKIVFHHLKQGNFCSYRVGSKWTDNSKLTFISEINSIKVDFYLNSGWAEKNHGEEVSAAEMEFYKRIDALNPVFTR